MGEAFLYVRFARATMTKADHLKRLNDCASTVREWDGKDVRTIIPALNQIEAYKRLVNDSGTLIIAGEVDIADLVEELLNDLHGILHPDSEAYPDFVELSDFFADDSDGNLDLLLVDAGGRILVRDDRDEEKFGWRSYEDAREEWASREGGAETRLILVPRH